MLCCVTLTVSCWHAWNTAQEVQAIAVVDDIAVILAILAACGAGYVGYEWYQSGAIEDFVKEVQVLDEKIGEEFDNSLESYIASEWPGYDPNDFDPDNDDPNEKPPKWEKLKAWAKAHPGATLALGAGGAMATVVTAITPEILKTREEGKVKPDDITYTQDVISKMLEYSNDYPYIVHFYANSTSGYVDMYKTKPIVYKSNNYMVLDNRNIPGNPKPDLSCIHIQPSGNIWIGNSYSNYNLNPGQHSSLLSTNLTIYDSLQDAVSNYGNDSVKYPGTINPVSLPLSTDIMDWLNQNPGKDAPDQPLYDNVKIPTQEEVDTFIQDLEKSRDDEDIEDEQQRQIITNEFIQNITNVTTDPVPDPKPDPDPEPTPDPDPEPDPNPDPSPDIPDNPTEDDVKDYLADFKEVFPFCIPFDFIRLLDCLDAEPEAPKFNFEFNYDKLNIHEDMVIDLSIFAPVAELIRITETMLFILGLMFATKSVIKW